MPAGHGDGIDGFDAQFIGELLKLLVRKAPQVRGLFHRVEKRPVLETVTKHSACPSPCRRFASKPALARQIPAIEPYTAGHIHATRQPRLSMHCHMGSRMAFRKA